MVTYAAGEVVGFELPNASLPPTAPPEPGRSAVDGAFGIDFGADLGQFANISCDIYGSTSEVCANGIAEDLWGDVPVSSDSPNVNDVAVVVDFERPPRPVPGAANYSAMVTLAQGIEHLAVEFRFRSAAECDEERARVLTLVRGKYAECRTRGVNDDGSLYRGTHLGQCDARGFAARSLNVGGCYEYGGRHKFSVYYWVPDEKTRRETVEAWSEPERPTSDHF